jgi:hypothetical protein
MLSNEPDTTAHGMHTSYIIKIHSYQHIPNKYLTTEVTHCFDHDTHTNSFKLSVYYYGQCKSGIHGNRHVQTHMYSSTRVYTYVHSTGKQKPSLRDQPLSLRIKARKEMAYHVRKGNHKLATLTTRYAYVQSTP